MGSKIHHQFSQARRVKISPSPGLPGKTSSAVGQAGAPAPAGIGAHRAPWSQKKAAMGKMKGALGRALSKHCNGKVQVEAVQCLLEQFSKQKKPQTSSHKNPQTRPKTQTLLLSCSQE